jgi:hypothetical protein
VLVEVQRAAHEQLERQAPPQAPQERFAAGFAVVKALCLPFVAICIGFFRVAPLLLALSFCLTFVDCFALCSLPFTPFFLLFLSLLNLLSL